MAGARRIGWIVLLLAGCGEPGLCPEVEIPIVPLAGEPVEATQVWCDGDPGFLCGQPMVARVGATSPCGDAVVTLQRHEALIHPTINLHLDLEGERAFGRIRSGCDDDGCEPDVRDATGGWVQITAWEEELASGWFTLEFAGGGLRGSFDTSYVPPDEGIAGSGDDPG